MASEPRRKYTEEFKRDAVELVRNSGKSQAQIARELGTSAHNISRWCLEYGEKENPVGEHEINPEAFRAMERELHRVKEERDILKKALNIFSRNG
ncbi:MAG: transposase [Candidatus Hydrogenedens sp.]|nr:transposase [Candidatus Hydrogenedens sp.]